MENYEIQLGVSLDTSDLKTKISQLDGKHSVKLGVDLKVNDIRDRIRQYNTNSNNAKVKLGIKLDTSDLKQQIAKLNLGGASNAKGVAIPVNTQSLENSLKEVKGIITDIKTALGTLDNSGDMKSLLSSVNQIASALDKATDESNGLLKSLDALSKKDFNFNFGLDMGKKNNNMIAYGRAARKQVIPELELQIKELENIFGGQQAVMNRLVSQGSKVGFDVFTDFNDFNADSAIKRMEAMEKYINSMKKLAAIDNVDLSGFDNQFSKSASELINDITGVENAVDKAGDIPEKLKNLFGGSVDGEGLSKQLDSIVVDLGEIKTVIQGMQSGVSLEGLTQSFDRLSDSIELLVKNCTTAKQVINDTVSGLGGSTGKSDSGVKNLNNDLKQVTVTADNTADAIDSMKNAMSSMKFNTASIDAATKDLEEMNVVIKEVTAKQGKNFDITVKGINDVGEAVEVVKRFNDETGNFETISTKISKPFEKGAEAARDFKKQTDTVKNIKFDIEVGNFANDVEKMHVNFDKLSSASDELRISLKKVDDAYESMLVAAKADTGDEVADRERLIQAEKSYAEALERTNNLIKQQARIEKTKADSDRLQDDREIYQAKIDSWLTKNSAATEQFGNKLLELRAKAETADRVELNHLEKELTKVDKAADKAELKMQNLGDRIKTKAKEYMAYFSVAEAFMYVEQALKAMFDTVLEIDTAMTGLYRVTDLTSAQYDTLFNNMISSAKEYGATLKDIINATTDWVRAGFDADTALGMAEITTMYQHISDLDYDTAAENLLTAYNGFKDELNGLFDGDEVASVNYIADILNELDNNFAVTSAGLGDALKRSASALDLAGNSIQETAGMVTGIAEVTQDPEKAGNALKILSLRLRGMKGELEELGEETDENVENISKMQGQILNMTKGKVNIFDASGDFKSTYEIMKGIAEVWDDLSSIDQANLLETIAGKHRANDVAALLSNWENVESAIKSANEAHGSAARENAKYVDSMQGRLDKLTTVWQSFANTFMESDFLKGTISGLSDLLELIEKLVKNVGTLGTIGLGAGIFGLFKNRKGLFGDLSTFGSIASDVISSSSTLTDKFKDIGSAAGMAGGSIAKRLTSTLSGTIGVIGLLTTAVGLAINAYKNYKEEISKARQETIATSDTFLDAADSFEQVYIKYSGRTDLTAEEEAELESAIKGTVDALDDKSNKLHDVVNSSNDYIASLEAITDAELKAAEKAAKEKQKNAKLELEDATKDWYSDNTAKIQIQTDSDAYEIAKGMDSDFFDSKLSKHGKGRTKTYWFDLPSNADADTVLDYYYTLTEYKEKLLDVDDFDTNEEVQTAYEKVNTTIEKLSETVKVYEDGLYDLAKAEYEAANGIPKTTEEYLKMRETIFARDDVARTSFDTKQTILSQLDSYYGQIFDLSSAEAQARKFVGIIKGYGNGTKDGSNEIGTVETFLNMRTAVNNNECTVSEYLAQFDEIDKISKNWSDEEKKLFNTTLGIDTDSIKKQYEEAEKYLTRQIRSKSKGESISDYAHYRNSALLDIENFLGNLTASELEAVIQLKTEIDWDNASAEDIRKQIEDQVKFNEAMNYTISVDIEAEGIEALNTAMAESVSGVGLSSESISALKDRYSELTSQGYDLSSMFEETSNGIHLNRNAVNELEQALASQKLSETDDKLEVLKGRYDELTEEIKTCTDAGERAHLYNEQQDVARKINDLATLASQYEGLTSAYNAWISAEESGSERDMYENLLEGFETVEDEISRGWLDDGTIKFLELLTGRTDLATLSAKELKDVYKGLDKNIKNTSHSIRDFFTVDEDGNSTSQGVYNFLDAVGQLEEEKFGGKDVVKRDKNGKIISFDFNVAGGDKAIAEALGISEELVQIMQRAADDAGFVVTLDGSYTQLADLKTSAEKSNDSLKKLKSEGLDSLKDADLNFDFDANNLEDLNTQLEKATTVLDKFKDKNGQLKKDKNGNLVKGAEEALEIASYFTATLDKLTEPVYMQLETNQVEKDLQEPLEKMQEFERLSKEKHQLELTGDTEDLKKVEKEMNEIVDYIYENDDLKAKLEIEGLSKEEIKSKLEKGEIEIPATVDIQLEMSEDIKDMRLMMMNQLGLISDEQLKLEIEFDVDYSAVENYEPETQKAIVEYFETHEEVDKYKPEDKKALVRLIAQKDNPDDWKIEDVEAYIKYYADDEQIKEWTPEEKRAYAKYLVDGGDPDKYQPPKKDQKVKAKLDSSEPDGYNAPPKDQQITAKLDSGKVDSYQPKPKTLTINAVFGSIKNAISNAASAGKKVLKKRFGVGGVNGTANTDGSAFVNGTIGKAYKQGDWRTNKSETALTGELGREIVVTPQNQWYTVGDNGAEFINIPRGSIVFNHRQTEELLKNGRATSNGGRAKALVSGTAYGKGTGGGIEPEVKSSSVGGNKDKSSSDKDFEEVLDWIEIIIDRVERSIDKFDQQANNIYKSWSSRNNALLNQISEVNKEIGLQQQAKNKYLSKANSIGLPESYASKIRNGSLSIEDFKGESDEKLVEKIKDYQTWYEKSLDCEKAIRELQETESKLYAQRVENVATQYEGILGVIEHEKNMIEEYISQSEANAQLISGEYYKALISNENETVSKLQEQKNKMLSELQAGMESGKIVKYTEGWYNLINSIDEVTLSIIESQTQIKEWNQTIQQLSWETFDLLQDKISAVTEEADFLIELMSSDKLHDDNGKLTDEGSATMGLHGQNYNAYMYQADLVAKEAERLRKQMSTDGYDTELEERYREMISLQQEYILNAEDEKNAIRDLVSDGIELELDALQELIDKKNEELESERDLYEHQKKVLEQTKEISSLEKQIASYSGDTSEEAKAKIQELKVSLEEAKTDLEETEYDKYISDQSAMLDNLYLEYETILNARLDNLDALVSDVITQINTDAISISTTLSEKADSVGYTLSSSMTSIWDTNSTKINSVITTYGEKFTSAQTTTNNALSTINTNLQNMINQLNTIAKTNTKSASTSSAANSKQASTSKPTTTTTPKPSIPSTPTVKVGGMVNAGSAKIYDYVGDTSGERQYYRNDPKYKVLKENGNWIQVRWHKLSSGITGWFKKGDVKAYKTGVRGIDESQFAWTQEGNKREFIVRPSDGAILTPLAKGDSVLNANASGNIWSMANNPADFIKDNLNLGGTDIPNNLNVNNTYHQTIENVVFDMKNVKNYEELLQSFSKDPKFEKLLHAMTIDRIAGGSSLAKGKVIKK